MQKNRISTSVIALISFWSLTSAVIASNTPATIKDVSPTDPKLGIYQDLIQENAITLDKSSNFNPNLPINKAAFLKAALIYAGYKPQTSLNLYTGFTDVPEQSWFAPYVKKALDSRIISNQGNQNFLPESILNRQEALLLSMSIFSLPTPLIAAKSSELYGDIRPNHPLASTYAAAHNYKIYFENNPKEFFPTKPLTRGDAADLLFKTKLAQTLLNFSNSKGLPSISITVPSSYLNQNSTTSAKDITNNDKFSIVQDAWDKINSEYISHDKVNQEQLIYGAISGMVNTLDDPYSTFKTPDENGESYVFIPENYEGIGAIISQEDGNYFIESTISNGPAFRAGLLSNDIITKIEGQTVKDLSLEQILQLMKGKAGTKLNLQILRNDKPLSFQITREKITVVSIHPKDLGNGIYYLKFDEFTENSAKEFQAAVDLIKTSGNKKIIIDLRNNPGGYLTTAQEILGHFLTQDQIEFTSTDANNQTKSYKSSGNGELKSYQIVVLINENSASASEIFAGALQDYKLAYLIGTKSYGKGSIQQISTYFDNSSLKLTTAHWFTPNHQEINHIGLKPDQQVTITDQQKKLGQDPQLDAAIEHLK